MSDTRTETIKWVFASLSTFLTCVLVGICIYTGYKSKAISIAISGLCMILSIWIDIGQESNGVTNCLVEVHHIPCKFSFFGIWGYTLTLMNIIMPSFVFPRNGPWGGDPNQIAASDYNTFCCSPLSPVPFLNNHNRCIKCLRFFSPSACINRLCSFFSCCRCGWVWTRWVKAIMFFWMCLFVLFTGYWGSLQADFASSFFWVLYIPVLLYVMKREYKLPNIGEKIFISTYICLILFQGLVTTISIGYEWTTQDVNASLPLGASFYILLLVWPLLTLVYFRWFLHKDKKQHLQDIHAYPIHPLYSTKSKYIQQIDMGSLEMNRKERDARLETMQFSVDMNPSDTVNEYKETSRRLSTPYAEPRVHANTEDVVFSSETSVLHSSSRHESINPTEDERFTS